MSLGILIVILLGVPGAHAVQPASVAEAERLVLIAARSLRYKDFGRAIPLLEKAAEMDADTPVPYFYLGRAYVLRGNLEFCGRAAGAQAGWPEEGPASCDTEDAALAKGMLETALALDPSLKKVPDVARFYYDLALAYRAKGEYQAAAHALQGHFRTKKASAKASALRDSLRDAIADRPGEAGRAESASGGRGPGIPDGERRAERSEPGHARPRSAAERGGGRELKAILQEPKRVERLDTTQRSVLFSNIGLAYEKMGLNERALQSYQYAVQEFPRNASAHYHLARAYALAGDLENAYVSLKSALLNAGNPRELRRILLLARTDFELEPLRASPEALKLLNRYSKRPR